LHIRSGFKVPVYELEERLTLLPPAEGVLPIEQVQALKKLGPTPEEKEAYERYKGDKALLSDMDQFLMALLEIPELNQRLNLQVCSHRITICLVALQRSKAQSLGTN
jgi:hypothetical protein